MSAPTLAPSPAAGNVQDTPGGWPPSPQPEPQESTPQTLSQAVRARKAEYVRKKTIKIKVGTWNVAASPGADKDVGEWFVDGKGDRTLSDMMEELSTDKSKADSAPNIESVEDQEKRRSKKKSTVPEHDKSAVAGGDEIGLYVLGLQEIIDISSATEALRPYVDPNPGKRWKDALKEYLPPGYVKVAEQQLLGMLILIYASPDVASSINDVSSTSVGTGLMGYMGNKGATSVRLMLGETTRLLFVNCHLSAGADNTATVRRNWDTNQILSRTRFRPIKEDGEPNMDLGEKIGDEDFAFWFGDLNYRLDDIPGDDVRRLLLLHTRNEYDIENKSKRKIDTELGYVEAGEGSGGEAPVDQRDMEDVISRTVLETTGMTEHIDPKSDPASLHTTIQSLLPHDQLRGQQKANHAFHDGWQEGEIGFLPTYKYDIGSVGMFDSGEKKRSPSWCDRILYRTRKSKLEAEKRMKDEAEARKKDDDMKKRGLDEAADENRVLFDYDPDADGLAYEDDYDEAEDGAHDTQLAQSREESDDSITLEQYVSHQRILSSDHKPLGAVFTLKFDAAVPELKAKIHAEVARELDKVENENRPNVTIVMEHHSETIESSADESIEHLSDGMNGIDFGKVRYGVLITRGLTIANTGQAAATFSFVDRPVAEGQGGGIAPSWLHLKVDMQSATANENANALREYTLRPGDSTNVMLMIDVLDLKMVHDLNEGLITMDDILVLRITGGRDHFIPIRAQWLPCCLCRTLDELVSVPDGGVRNLFAPMKPKLPPRPEPESGRPTIRRSATRHSAPKELFMLTEAISGLTAREVAGWDMIHAGEAPPWSGKQTGASWPFGSETWTLPAGEERSSLVATTIEALDTLTPFSDLLPTETSVLVRLEICVEVLFIFLKGLRDGIVPLELWPGLEEMIVEMERGKEKEKGRGEEGQAWVMEVLSQMPVHSVAFTFVTFMLGRIIDEFAPMSKTTSTKAPTPRLSTSSQRSENSESSSGAPHSPETSSSKSSFLHSTFRRAGRKSTSAESAVPVPPSGESLASLDRRKAYVDVFAGLLVRTGREGMVKGKEKKVLEGRKRRVLEPFLEG